MAKWQTGALPGAVVIACPACDAEIELKIPIQVRIRKGDMSFRVDNKSLSVQPVWDHQLLAHGPRIDD